MTDKTTVHEYDQTPASPVTGLTESPGVFSGAGFCLSVHDPVEKCEAVHLLWQRELAGTLVFDDEVAVEEFTEPGRPAKPELVEPAKVPRRRLGSSAGRAALVHAIAHIEFNAINLALDAVYRFRGRPRAYYREWLSVAADEARHFTMLAGRLGQLGFAYGDFPAHNGLWEMALKTRQSCLERMALVPRVLEARGLDVTPGMIEKLRQVDDLETVAALEIILAEEIRHVEIGSWWFRHCCAEQGVDPETTFIRLLGEYFGGSLRGPFNLPARIEAGFTQAEMDAISGLSPG